MLFLKAASLLSSRQSYTRKFQLGIHNAFVQYKHPYQEVQRWAEHSSCYGWSGPHTVLSENNYFTWELQENSLLGLRHNNRNRLNAIMTIYKLMPPFCYLVTELSQDPQKMPTSTQTIGTAFLLPRESSVALFNINHSLNLITAGIN